MSRIHRIGRSLGVASIGLILVSGASFAHDASSDTPSSAPAWEANQGVQTPGVEADDRQGDDTDEVDELDQERSRRRRHAGRPRRAGRGRDRRSRQDGRRRARRPAAKPAKPPSRPRHRRSTRPTRRSPRTTKTRTTTTNDEADDNDSGRAITRVAITRMASTTAATRVAAATTTPGAEATTDGPRQGPSPVDAWPSLGMSLRGPGVILMDPAASDQAKGQTDRTVIEPTTSDRQVVDAVLAGDREAFRVLVERESWTVIGVCRRVLGDPTEAEDAAQDTFTRAYEALATYRGDGPVRGVAATDRASGGDRPAGDPSSGAAGSMTSCWTRASPGSPRARTRRRSTSVSNTGPTSSTRSRPCRPPSATSSCSASSTT